MDSLYEIGNRIRSTHRHSSCGKGFFCHPYPGIHHPYPGIHQITSPVDNVVRMTLSSLTRFVFPLLNFSPDYTPRLLIVSLW